MAWGKAGRSISGPRANRGEASFLPALGPVSPAHIFATWHWPACHRRRRQYIGDVPLDRGYLVALVFSDTQEVWIAFNRGRY